MNSLSWMIYAADVAGGLDSTIATAAGITFAAGLCCTAAAGWYNICADDADRAIRNALIRVATFRFMPACAALAIMASVIPSQSTIYAIAASEMGEDVLNSETGSKAMQALDAWLDRQIAGEPTQ